MITFEGVTKQYPDGTTDITRTVAIATPTAEMKDRYTRVLKGHIALAVARFPRGTRGGQLDILARQFLWSAGLDYAHGTGHGVGHFLGVHDGPQRIAAAVGALFADPNVGRDAVYIADGGAPVLVRVVARRADAITDFGDARLWSETTRIDLRVAEVANPRPGDRIEIDGDAFLIQGEPVRDRERLVWTVDLRPA